MSNNNSNFSIPTNNNNYTSGGQSGSNSGSSDSNISNLIQLPIHFLTIILAIAYTILVLVRPTFRNNKLNWFTINLCLMSVVLSLMMLTMSIKQIMDDTSSSIPCRLQGFLLTMPACQLMYSHAVIAVSRLLTIVYANKHFFRSTKCLWICLGFGWLSALLVSVPYLFVDGFTCSSSAPSDFLPYYNLAVVLIVPVLIVIVCNIRIFLFVRQSSRRVHAEGGGGEGVSNARDIRLLKTMIATFTVFVGGWLPLFLTQTFSQTVKTSSISNAIFQILPPLSMLSDVILLIYINQPIRLFLWQLIVKQHRTIDGNALDNKAQTRGTVMHKQ